MRSILMRRARKLLLSIAVLLLTTAAPVVAATEIDFLTSGSCMWMRFSGGKYIDASVYPLCTETIFNFFFIPIGKATELGLSMNVAYGMGFSIAGAPVIRHTWNDSNSVSLSVGVTAAIPLLFDYFYYQAVAVSLAHKHWLVNQPGFHFGLYLGIEADIPFAGAREYSHYYYDWYGKDHYYYDEMHDITSGFVSRMLFGICINIGDRAYDKRR